MEAAKTFWNSDEYEELKRVREGSADINVYLVEITGD